MSNIIELLNLINTAAPGIAKLVLMVRHRDNTISIIAMLDEADAQFDANIKQAKDWLAAHPKKEPV